MFKVSELIKATSGRESQRGKRLRLGGVCIDSRTIGKNEIFIAIVGKKFDGHDFIDEAVAKGAGCILYCDASKVKSFKKGIYYIKVKDTTRALGDLASFHRLKFDIPVIAVTGSNGKTTTKEMLACVLSAKYNVLKNEGTKNNLIGLPLTLLKLCGKHTVCVVELGTNRKGEISRLADIAKPNIGVITNIGPSHLEFLGDLRGVYKEKTDLIKKLSSPAIAVLNKSDIALKPLSKITSKPLFFYGINCDCDFKASEITIDPQNISFLLNNSSELKLKHCGTGNISNALAAVGCALILGLDIEDIKGKMCEFDSPAMRLKEIVLSNKIVLDDSYNSNPQSLKQAIDVLSSRKASARRILVMADMLELGKKSEEFHAYFGRYVTKKSIDLLVTFGDFSKIAAQTAKEHGMGEDKVFHFSTYEEMESFLAKHVKDGDILLVKGSRSFRMERIVNFLKTRS